MKYIKQEDIPAKNWDGKLYKVFDADHRPTNGTPEDWSLPENGKPGEWTRRIDDVKMCRNGWHLTTHYAHWLGSMVYEAESDSIVEFDGYDKVVCERVRLIRLVVDLSASSDKNTGKHNTGKRNSGNFNSGSNNSGSNNSGDLNSGSNNTGRMNSGNSNTGDCNGGNRNTESRNTGDSNTGWENDGNWNSGSFNRGDYDTGWGNCGNFNSGNYNSGNYNTGQENIGNRNTGNRNAGNSNTGWGNAGDWNSGNFNSGQENSGSWNSGNLNSGNWNTCNGPYLNLCTVGVKYLFNRPVIEWPKFPGWMHFCTDGESLEDSWAAAFEGADREGIEELVNLPNFDYGVFGEISGITETMIRDKLEGK